MRTTTAKQKNTPATPPPAYSPYVEGRVNALNALIDDRNHEIEERTAWANTLKMILELDVKPGIEKYERLLASLTKASGLERVQKQDHYRLQIESLEDMEKVIWDGPEAAGGSTGNLADLLTRCGVRLAPNQSNQLAGRTWLRRTEKRLAELTKERDQFEKELADFTA